MYGNILRHSEWKFVISGRPKGVVSPQKDRTYNKNIRNIWQTTKSFLWLNGQFGPLMHGDVKIVTQQNIFFKSVDLFQKYIDMIRTYNTFATNVQKMEKVKMAVLDRDWMRCCSKSKKLMKDYKKS